MRGKIMDDILLDLRDKRNKSKSSLNKKIGERLKILADENNMSNIDFGTKIGLPIQDNSKETTVSKYFSGEKELDIYTLKKISKEFKVSINWILASLPLEIRNDRYYNVYKKTILSEDAIDKIQTINKNSSTSGLLEYLLANETFTDFLESFKNYYSINFRIRLTKLANIHDRQCLELGKEKEEALKNNDINKLEKIKKLEKQGMRILKEKDKKSKYMDMVQKILQEPPPEYYEEPFLKVTLEEALNGTLLKVSRLAEQLANEYVGSMKVDIKAQDNKNKK